MFRKVPESLFSLIWRSLVVILLISSVPYLANATPITCRRVEIPPEAPLTKNPLRSINSFEKRKQWIFKTFERGQKSFDDTTIFIRQLKNLDKETQGEWIQAIASVYRLVPKKNPTHLNLWAIGGRRLLDRVLFNLQRADLFFTERTKQVTAREAFLEYLAQQSKLFGSGYDGARLLKVAEMYQAYVRKFAENHKGPPSSILMAGSFLHGKGNLKESDSDISVSDKIMLDDVAELERRLNELFSDIPGTHLTIEPHTDPAGFYAQLNPLVLIITPNEIKLMVFEPSYQRDGTSLTIRGSATYVL